MRVSVKLYRRVSSVTLYRSLYDPGVSSVRDGENLPSYRRLNRRVRDGPQKVLESDGVVSSVSDLTTPGVPK